jgi:hypothetical protein
MGALSPASWNDFGIFTPLRNLRVGCKTRSSPATRRPVNMTAAAIARASPK